MEKPRIFLDTDVLINWIAKEVYIGKVTNWDEQLKLLMVV